MNLEFNVNEIIDAKVVNPLIELEAASTDFVTESFFGNGANRYNFYWLIQYLFDKFKKEILIGDLEKFKDDVTLIFKGGNIIKAVIDKAEKNIQDTIIKIETVSHGESVSEYSLDKYTQTKRSDSDFSIYINYPKIEKALLDQSMKNLVFIKITLACEKIAYLVLKEIRNKYNQQDGTIKIEEIEFPFQITNLNDNLFTTHKLYENYNQKFKDLVTKTYDHIVDRSKGNQDESILQFLTNKKNIVMKFISLLTNKNVIFGDNTTFNGNTEIFNIIMPKVKGILINEYAQHNMDGITETNTISLSKLINILTGEKVDNGEKKLFSRNLSTHKQDMEIYFSDENEKPVITDDESLSLIGRKKNEENVLYGYSIKNIDFDNTYLFENFDNLSKDDLVKKKITNRILKLYENNNSLFISSNRTLRFLKNYTNTAFNLIRMKHNIRVYFELPKLVLQINNKKINIKYVYVNIPGEFIDITVPTSTDYSLGIIMKNKEKYISKREMIFEITNNPDKKYITEISTYSNYGLVHDIAKILYDDTNNIPWLDVKYEKRLERLFRLYFADMKANLNISQKIGEKLNHSYLMLNKISEQYTKYQETRDNNIIDTIKYYIRLEYHMLNLIDEQIEKNSDTMITFFKMILGPCETFNDITNVDEQNESLEGLIKYVQDITKYYKIFVENIGLPSEGNLYEIQLGGFYKKYLKYKHKYLELKK